MWKSTFVRASQLPTVRRRSDSRVTVAVQAGEPSLVLGRYRLGRRLGAGSFGTVWQAHDEQLEREVAVKVLPRKRVMDARFEREAKAAARLSHPGIVTLYEAAEDEEAAYLVSELVTGSTLDELLDAGRLSDSHIVSIGIALCEGLSHAHSRGVVHRDVKPSNVLVPARPASDAYPAKLTDFGVARVLGGDSLTRTGDIVGTDAYMAPEQAVGREAGAAADLYALALVLYEALTGVNPVAIDGRRAARLGAHLPPLRRQRRDLPRELGRAIDLALRPRPRERGTVEELQQALSVSLAELSDMAGVVEGPWRPRLPFSSPGHEPGEALPRQQRAIRSEPPAARKDAAAPRSVERACSCAAAAVLAVWLGTHVLGTAAIAPAAIGLLAAGLVLLLPRIGYGTLALFLFGAAALHGHLGLGLLLAIGAAVPVLLMPRDATAWPLAVGAPLLGMVGLAGAWPALAARASSTWRRAALGAGGWLWLAIATPLRGSRLYLPLLPGTPPGSVWNASVYETVHHVIPTILNPGVVAVAVVWALASVVFGKLVGSKSLAIDVLRVTGWAGIVVASSELFLRSSAATPTAGAAVLGAAASGAVALAPVLIASWRPERRAEQPRAGLP